LAASLGGERQAPARCHRVPREARLIKTMLLIGTLALAGTTAASAQSYDPDIGSGNLVRSHRGAGGFGHVHPAWRAQFIHRHAKHIRHHHKR